MTIEDEYGSQTSSILGGKFILTIDTDIIVCGGGSCGCVVAGR